MHHHQLDPSEIEKLLADIESKKPLDARQTAYAEIFRTLKQHGGRKITIDATAKQRLRNELLQSYDDHLKKPYFFGMFRWMLSPVVGSALAFGCIGIITISLYSQLFFESKSIVNTSDIQRAESIKDNLPTYMKQEESQETSKATSNASSPSQSSNNSLWAKEYFQPWNNLDMISGKSNSASQSLKGSAVTQNSFEPYLVYGLVGIFLWILVYFYVRKRRKK